MIGNKMRDGLVFRFQAKNMDEPQFYMVHHCIDKKYRGGEWLCWRTDFLIESKELRFTDLWRLTQKYFDKCIEDGSITLIENNC